MTRSIIVVVGLGVLAAAWLGPLPSWSRTYFSAHMALHMAVVAVAAPLVAIGVSGTRLDPVRLRPRLFPPLPMSLVELAVVWAWHTPALHRSARGSAAGFAVEQAAFLLAGLGVWLSVFGGEPRWRERRAGAGVVALLLTSMHMTLLGALLALTSRPLFAGFGHGGRMGGLADEHLGGAIMLVVGGAVYLSGGLWLTASLLGRRVSEGSAT